MSESDSKRFQTVSPLFGDTHNGVRRPELEPREIVQGAFLRSWARVRELLAEEAVEYVMAVTLPDSDEVIYRALRFETHPFMRESLRSDLVIGRHAQCDIHLESDESLSLRHFLLRMFKAKCGDVSLRCMDLFTVKGLRDQDGAVFRNAQTQSHLFFRAGDYVVLLLNRGASNLPAEGGKAWAALQEKSAGRFSSTNPLPKHSLQPRPRLQLVSDMGAHPEYTSVEGPLHLGTVDLASDKAIGVVSLRGWDTDVSIPLPAKALARGIMVGRYARCQIRTEIHGDFSELSRVHLLLLLDESGLWAIDTASSNGTTMDGRYFRTARLGGEALIELPGEITLRWQPV